MFVAEKVLLLLVISLTVQVMSWHHPTKQCPWGLFHLNDCAPFPRSPISYPLRTAEILHPVYNWHRQTHQHDDFIKWKHFPRYWPFVQGIHRSTVNSPHKGQWRGALMFPLICAWIKGWVNNREAGDLRRSHAHYDVTVMKASKHIETRTFCILQITYPNDYHQVCFWRSNQQEVKIGLGNGLVQNRQDITLINDDLIHWCIHVSPTLSVCFIPSDGHKVDFVTHKIAINTLRPRQNGRHFTDDMFKCIFLNENVWIMIEVSLTFVPMGSINNHPALFQIMAWRCLGDKPLSEPMMVSSLTHICVTRPQWVEHQHNILMIT